MATSLRPLTTAIVTKLTGSADLMAKVSGVYSKVPEPAPYPFVSIGSVVESMDDMHDAQGLSSLVPVHVWSQQDGDAELFDVFALVDAALDRVPLELDGFRYVYIHKTQHSTVPDPDPRIRHLNATYLVTMTKE